MKNIGSGAVKASAGAAVLVKPVLRPFSSPYTSFLRESL
jgi:hypothetical protein